MSEKWEIVVKGGKSKPETKMSAKDLKQIKEANLNGNRFNRGGVSEDTDESVSPNAKKVTKGTKNKSKTSAKSDGDNLSQQIIKLNSENIKVLHKDLCDKFSNQPTVILMDLALHLNLMLKITEDTMKNISFDNFDFPYALLSNDTKTTLRNVFNGLNNVNLGSFLKSAMLQIIEDNEKGIKSVGLQMLVQVCLKMKPAALISNRKTIFDLINMYRDHSTKFKCFIWVLKQACINFNVASQIWLIYLLPFSSQRCHTETVVTFGEVMMSYPTDHSGNDNTLLPADFLPLVDLIFNQNDDHDANLKKSKKKVTTFQLSQSHLQRLVIIYHKIKDQVFTSKTPGSLKDYFASLFLRLSLKNKNEQFNKELLDCLEQCLTSCPESTRQLDNLYSTYPLQTKIFLDHFSSSKSAASAIVMKHKSSKDTAGKNNSNAKRAEIKSNNMPSFSYMNFIFKVLMYVIIMGFTASVVIRYQYPQHYKQMMKKIQPRYDSVLTKATPYLNYFQEKAVEGYNTARPYVISGADKIKVLSWEAWIVSKPYVNNVISQVQKIGHYVYGKVDEVAPQVLEKIATIYVSVDKYVSERYKDMVKYFNSPQFQEVLQSISTKTITVAEQVQLGYKSLVAYMFKVVGY